MHSNIKVRTIVNIMQVYNQYVNKIAAAERNYDYYKSQNNQTGMLLAKIELDKQRANLGEFLDYYV